MITKPHSCALIFVFLLPTYSCSFPFAVPDVPVWFSFPVPNVSVFSFPSSTCFCFFRFWSLALFFLFARMVPLSFFIHQIGPGTFFLFGLGPSCFFSFLRSEEHTSELQSH